MKISPELQETRLKLKKSRSMYFILGFVIASNLAGYVSLYWHSLDRLNVKSVIRINKKNLSRGAEVKKLRETPIYTQQQKKGAAKYYKMEDKENFPTMPELPKDYDNK